MIKFRFRERTNTWPGFVDLFSNLVIILIFLLIVFVFLWTTTSVFNKSSGIKTITELKKTNEEQSQTIAQMSADEQEAKRLLILARGELENLATDKVELENELGQMDMSMEELVNAYEQRVQALQETAKQAQENAAFFEEKATDYENHAATAIAVVENLQASEAEMQNLIAELNAQLNQAQMDKASAEDLEQQRRQLQAQMDEQRMSLAEQLSQLQAALDAAEAKASTQEIQYVELSNRLNKALADKISELQKMWQFQSDFYKAIKLALGDRTSIQQDGDRFIVSSDILFSSGEYKLSAEGKNQLRLIANVIKDLESKIPTDVNWIIRVDGHTDKTRVVPGNRAYKNNTQLSLLRATAVSDELVVAGVSKRRLVPTGFGEMYPVELGNDANSLQKNRRIELQLTNR